MAGTWLATTGQEAYEMLNNLYLLVEIDAIAEDENGDARAARLYDLACLHLKHAVDRLGEALEQETRHPKRRGM